MQKLGILDIDQVNCMIKLELDGIFIVYFGGVDIGIGLDIVVMKLVVEVLYCLLQDVYVIFGDIDYVLFDKGVYVLFGICFLGNVVCLVVENLREKILFYGV